MSKRLEDLRDGDIATLDKLEDILNPGILTLETPEDLERVLKKRTPTDQSSTQGQ